jgi:hypothetical protein
MVALTALGGRKESFMTKKVLFVCCCALIAAAFVSFQNATANAANPAPRVIVADGGDCIVESVPVVRAKPVRPRALLRQAPPAVIAEVERRPAFYRIVEQPRDPYVVRGPFKDRVVFPKRPLITIEAL